MKVCVQDVGFQGKGHRMQGSGGHGEGQGCTGEDRRGPDKSAPCHPTACPVSEAVLPCFVKDRLFQDLAHGV